MSTLQFSSELTGRDWNSFNVVCLTSLIIPSHEHKPLKFISFKSFSKDLHECGAEPSCLCAFDISCHQSGSSGTSESVNAPPAIILPWMQLASLGIDVTLIRLHFLYRSFAILAC